MSQPIVSFNRRLPFAHLKGVRNESTTQNRLVFLLITMLVSLCTAYSKTQSDYGWVYNVEDFIVASAGDDVQGINRCLTDVQLRVWNGASAVTILFPRRINGVYTIYSVLKPMAVNGYAFARQVQHLNDPCQINIIGLDEEHGDVQNAIGQTLLSSYGQTDWLAAAPGISGVLASQTINSYITNHAAGLNMTINGGPASATYLGYNTLAALPEIVSTANTQHNFFLLQGYYSAGLYCPWMYDPNNAGQAQLFNIRINIMGLRLRGLDMPNNHCVYDLQNPSAQHDQNFNFGTGIHLSYFRRVQVDNVIVENMYGNGIVVSNTSCDCPPAQTGVGVAYRNDENEVTVESNVIHNVWALLYKSPGNAYDDRGDGIQFYGIKGGRVERNVVLNDLAYTHQYGRIGISATAEHNWNIDVRENVIHGYDRGIHSEDNLGGFTIQNNRITGSETGIVFDNNLHYTGNFF